MQAMLALSKTFPVSNPVESKQAIQQPQALVPAVCWDRYRQGDGKQTTLSTVLSQGSSKIPAAAVDKARPEMIQLVRDAGCFQLASCMVLKELAPPRTPPQSPQSSLTF